MRKVFLSLMVLLGSLPSEAYDGPAGLKWGKSPADARSILAARFTFVEEKPAEEDRYFTIDQTYSGRFGGMPAVDIRLKFHKGEFFYLAVVLSTADAGSASKVFNEAVEKMREAYGEPRREKRAPTLTSSRALMDHLPIVGDHKGHIEQLLARGRGPTAQQDNHALLDLIIRTRLWDPFAEWRFKDGITVQVFLHFDRRGSQIAGPLMPIWIFVHDERFAAWRRDVETAKIITPRDY